MKLSLDSILQDEKLLYYATIFILLCKHDD